jgi:hypothetical protein
LRLLPEDIYGTLSQSPRDSIPLNAEKAKKTGSFGLLLDLVKGIKLRSIYVLSEHL